MRDLFAHMRRLTIIPVLAAAMMLAGCGPGIQLEGPGFEALGLTNKKHVEQKVPDRAPLLIPPDPNRLPEPAPKVATVRPENWPTDPEITLKAEASAAAEKQRIYEDKGDWSKKADVEEFEKLMDPIERHKGGLLDKVFERRNQTQREFDDPSNLDPGK